MSTITIKSVTQILRKLHPIEISISLTLKNTTTRQFSSWIYLLVTFFILNDNSTLKHFCPSISNKLRILVNTISRLQENHHIKACNKFLSTTKSSHFNHVCI